MSAWCLTEKQMGNSGTENAYSKKRKEKALSKFLSNSISGSESNNENNNFIQSYAILGSINFFAAQTRLDPVLEKPLLMVEQQSKVGKLMKNYSPSRGVC